MQLKGDGKGGVGEGWTFSLPLRRPPLPPQSAMGIWISKIEKWGVLA